MPRIRQLTEEDRRNDAVRGEIAKGIERNRIDNLKDLAKRMGIGEATIYRRMRNPGTWTLEEMRKLKRIMPGIEIE